jgi:glycosyltransferase involved in cell wall biosynthesis
LEAMTCGTPVVASSQAVSALDTRPGGDLLVAEGAEAFAQAVLRLLADADLRARLGADGRRYVEAHHDWRGVAEKLEGIYEEAIEEKKREERN